MELTTDIVRAWCLKATGEFHYKSVCNGGIKPELYDKLRSIIHELCEQKVIKSCGRNDGTYKSIPKVEPVKWWDDDVNEEPLDFRFPMCHEDNTTFGIEDFVEVFAGDLILITGDTNLGKTAIALSIMGENLGLFKGTTLMGSEYTASDGKISPKFKRRMRRMNWVEWMNGDGKPRFQLLPVGSDYEDYIEQGHNNIVDWISLPGEYYFIDSVMLKIKNRTGDGVAVVVLQKNKGQEFAEGGQRSERYADVVLKIDPFGDSGEGLLTIGKVKAPKGKATGRTFAFDIVDFGANLHQIREVVKCPQCRGRGYTGSANYYKKCDVCNGLKYIEK